MCNGHLLKLLVVEGVDLHALEGAAGGPLGPGVGLGQGQSCEPSDQSPPLHDSD